MAPYLDRFNALARWLNNKIIIRAKLIKEENKEKEIENELTELWEKAIEELNSSSTMGPEIADYYRNDFSSSRASQEDEDYYWENIVPQIYKNNNDEE